jgi:hypothetical protein
MDRLSKIKTLIGVIIFLLITNLVLVYFIVFQKPEVADKARETSTTYLLHKEVGFTDDQIVKYKLLKEAHYKNVQPYFDSLKISKVAFYRMLSNDIDEATINASSAKISNQENLLNIELFKFYKSARTLCTPEQYALFDSLIVKQMSNRMRRSGRR